MKILLVEDTDMVQMVTKALLVKNGYLVDIAADGETGVEMAIKNSYVLILMDIGLGAGIDGFEATRQIKQSSALNAETPIIAVTAHNTDECRATAKELGMVDFINKPITQDKIAHIIKLISK